MSLPQRFEKAVLLLGSPKSANRRNGAKLARALRQENAGPYLLDALRKEVRNSRTWETQYQMIMALGECGYTEALTFLGELSKRSFEATMIYVAIGDAMMRLSWISKNEVPPVAMFLTTRNSNFVEGALRAIAMLHAMPREHEIREIVEFVEKTDPEKLPDNRLWFWAAVAAAGWNTDNSQSFLRKCISTKIENLMEAAIAATRGKYLDCEIL